MTTTTLTPKHGCSITKCTDSAGNTYYVVERNGRGVGTAWTLHVAHRIAKRYA